MTSADPPPFATLCAWLVYEFKLTLPQIYRLTPRQVNDVYQHPRDKEGSLVVPVTAAQVKREPTADDRLAAYLRLKAMAQAGAVKMAPADREELDRRIRDLVEKRNARLAAEKEQHDNRRNAAQ